MRARYGAARRIGTAAACLALLALPFVEAGCGSGRGAASATTTVKARPTTTLPAETATWTDPAGDVTRLNDVTRAAPGTVADEVDMQSAELRRDSINLTLRITTTAPLPAKLSFPSGSDGQAGLIVFVLSMAKGQPGGQDVTATLTGTWTVTVTAGAGSQVIPVEPEVEGATLTFAIPLWRLKGLPASFDWQLTGLARGGGGSTDAPTAWFYEDQIPGERIGAERATFPAEAGASTTAP